MEGISNEACSLAGHWGLGKLIVFYDDNHISIDGDTAIAFTENVEDRFAAMGWHILFVENGNTDYDAIRQSIADAKAVTDKPTFIKVMLYFHSMFLSRCLASFNRSRSLNVQFHCRLPPLLGMVRLIKLIVTVFTVVHLVLKRWRLLERA